MTRSLGRTAPTVLLALLAPFARAGSIEIRHDPVACVPLDRYSRVSATAVPAEQVASAELQFRGSAAGGWYSVRMAGQGGAWSGVLPRPSRSVTQFEYRLVMTAADLSTAETGVLTVRVVEDPARCADGRDSAVSVAAPIVVRVPPGAPLVPPVPPGFSPAGVVAPAGPAPRDKWKAVKWIAGAGAAAGIGAAVAGLGSGPPELPAVPDFAFSGTVPNPGTEFSLSRDHLTVFVLVSGEPRAPLTFQWFFSLRQHGQVEVSCLTMNDTMTIGPERPVLLELSSSFHILGFCGNTFQVDSGRLTIVVDGQVVHESTQDLPFRIVI